MAIMSLMIAPRVSRGKDGRSEHSMPRSAIRGISAVA